VTIAAPTSGRRGYYMADWSRPFEDPIPLPDGGQLVTLKDAADYIMNLPKAKQNLDEWQMAIGCLIGAAEGRDFMMHARIGVLRALNRNIERTFTDRKEMHWGAGSSRETDNDSPHRRRGGSWAADACANRNDARDQFWSVTAGACLRLRRKRAKPHRIIR
jgi:hypothetical protein